MSAVQNTVDLGIPESRFPGPYPVGSYAEQLRRRLREFARVQLTGELWGVKPGRARVYFELRDSRGALPCSMWRDDFDRLGIALRDGMQVVVGGGCDYYPGSSSSSPSFTFAVSELRVAGEGDLLLAARAVAPPACRRWLVRATEAAAPTAVAAHDRRRHRRAGQGPRRRARRPAPTGLGRPAGVGVRPRPGSPRRTAYRRGAARAGRDRRGRGGDRRARRRLARRPVRVLRRGRCAGRWRCCASR